MAFYLTLFFFSLYYIRPFEFFSAIQNIPLLPIVGLIAFGSVVFSSQNNKSILKSGSDKLILGYMFAIAMSHLRHTYLQGTINSIELFLPTFFGYFLVVHSIQTKKQLNAFFVFLTIITCFLAIEGILEFNTGSSYFGIQPILERARNFDGEIKYIARIVWLGTLADPNDLAMALVIPVPYLVNQLLYKKQIRYLLLVGILLYAIVLTNSRGGMLAVCAGIAFYFILRLKSTKGLIGALIFVSVVLLFGPSRMSDLSASGESAAGRIEAWYAGYQMFMQYPIFGVGKGLFVDFNDLTAHNSFVLVLGELGLFGTFFFTGLFMFPFQFCSKYVWGEHRETLSEEELGFCASLYGSLIGLMVSMFFLSRSYVLIPYMLIGLCVVTSRLYREMDSTGDRMDVIPVKNIFIIMISSIVGIRVLVKLLL